MVAVSLMKYHGSGDGGVLSQGKYAWCSMNHWGKARRRWEGLYSSTESKVRRIAIYSSVSVCDGKNRTERSMSRNRMKSLIPTHPGN